MNQEKLKQFIIQLSAEAGEYLRNHFYTFKNVTLRDTGGLVTNIDLELAEIIRQRINQEYPDHQVVIQGDKAAPTNAAYVWLIDPLDGSSHFSHNIPVYTSSLALQHNGVTILGAVNQPQTNQLFFAQKDHGAYLNGIMINVSEQKDLSQAFIFVELPEQKFNDQQLSSQEFTAKMEAVSRLVSQTGQIETFRIGSFGQCLVASGAFDAYVDLSGSSEAISQAASQLILAEAGAKITALNQSKDDLVQVMATNQHLTKDLLKIING